MNNFEEFENKFRYGDAFTHTDHKYAKWCEEKIGRLDNYLPVSEIIEELEKIQ